MEPTLPASIDLAPWTVSLIAGTVIPLVVGLITKLRASAGLKAVVALLLDVVVTVANLLVTRNGHIEVAEFVTFLAVTFLIHVGSYLGLWKPVGGGAAPGSVATANVGIG